MTTLHEMGHALGLQHTFTSSTMSQATTRATTVTHPLDTDDIAVPLDALSECELCAVRGSITGRITAGGNGIHLASVVAIQSGTGAISTVTNPDGSFQINGGTAGQLLCLRTHDASRRQYHRPLELRMAASIAAGSGAGELGLLSGDDKLLAPLCDIVPVQAGQGHQWNQHLDIDARIHSVLRRSDLHVLQRHDPDYARPR